MDIETDTRGRYQLFRVKEDLTVSSDISPLLALVKQKLNEGRIHIALWFTSQSFLYSKNIAVLVQCVEMIKDRHGELAVVKPNEDVMCALRLIGFDTMARICTSEDELDNE